MYTFYFRCIDTGGKRQNIKVKANSKDEAIQKGFKRAEKNARGDIRPSWECVLATF